MDKSQRILKIIKLYKRDEIDDKQLESKLTEILNI